MNLLSNKLPTILTDLQHQVLVGSLLGDLHMSLDGINPRIKIDRQFKDKEYLNWQYNIFKDFCKSGIKEITRFDKRYNKNYHYVSFRTRSVPVFLKYYHQWYKNKIKIIPHNLVLTPMILAVWFCDDGCIIRNKNALVLKLSTESFGFEGTKLLSDKLEQRFNCKFPIYKKHKNKDQYIIKTATKSAKLFMEDIENIIKINGMIRKYNIWKK